MSDYTIHVGDCLEGLRELPAGAARTCVTSPPYFGLRCYNGGDAEIGKEPTPDDFVAALVAVFREVKRVLRDDGTLWLNLGDSYAGAGYSNHQNTGGTQRTDGGKQKHMTGSGLKNKDLIGIPWRVAFALQADGWYLRQDIIWAKPNPMPESVRDRCTKSHEYIFLLSKSPRYFFDAEAILESFADDRNGASGAKSLPYSKGSGRNDTLSDGSRPGLGVSPIRSGRNRRSVWTVSTKPFKGAHFATFPPDLILPCILAGCPKDGVVLDPFNGAGTTGLVSVQNNRNYIGIELNAEYLEMARARIEAASPSENNDFFVKKPTAPTLFDFMLDETK